MSSKTTYSIEAITNIFDVKRYADTEYFNMFDWHQQLLCRFANHSYCEEYLHKTNSNHLDAIIKSVLESPLRQRDILDLDILRRFDNPKSASETLSVALRYRPVGDMQICSILKAADKIEKELKFYAPYIDKYKNKGPDEELPKEIFDSYHSAVLKNIEKWPRTNDVFLSVDTTMPDEALIAGFSIWLKNKREELADYGRKLKRKRVLSSKDMESWFKNRTLPYLDLLFLSKCLGINIPYHKQGAIIFPDEYDIDLSERIRKVTKPQANWLIDQENIEMILATASSHSP
jgi:hypothetical protein